MSSVAILKDVLYTFSAKKYQEYTIYTIHGDTEIKKVYVFPNSASYENIKTTMREVLQAQNLMGDCSGKVLIGIRL